MGVINGQSVSAEITNPAFLDANANDAAQAVIGFNDQLTPVVSGSAVTNIQREANSVSSFLGKALNAIKNLLPSYSNNEGFTASQDIFTRVNAISGKFKQAGGHTHNPSLTGDGAPIDASYLTGVKLAALVQQGVNIIGATGVSSIITGQFTLKNPSSNATTKGVVVNAPQNMVILRQASGANQGDSFLDATGNIVYGRVTFSAGVWTLSFYSLISTTETAYSFGSATDISFYYQEIFNAITEGPVYNAMLFIPSENTTADVVDASITQRGVVTTGTQSFAGDKTFTGNLKSSGDLLGDSQTDSTTTGSAATIPNPTKMVYLLTNASLASISLITPITESQFFVLVNKTGNSVLINDLNTTAGHIRTGTGGNVTFRNNEALFMVYDKTNSRWVVVGGIPSFNPTTFGSTPNANGLTYDPVTGAFNLQPSSSTNPGGNSILDQDYKGEKRFTEGLAFQIGVDGTTVGAGQTVDGGSIGFLKVTNAGLTSISLILRKNSTSHLLVLTNGTGATITIQNLTGTETSLAKQINTGTSADLSLSAGASLFLIHDENSGKWNVVGGSGSGTGSAAGPINLITNGNADNATTSIFTPYANTAQRLPVTGAGGSPSVTTTVSSVNPLAGTKSFLLTKPSGALQGNGWSVPFSVDLQYRAKVLQIDVDYIVNSGVFVAGTASTDSDVIFYLYDITNNLLLEPSSIKLLSNSTTLSDKFRSSFQTSATGSSYRLIAHVATATASAFELKCEVAVTPTTYVYGTPISDWFSFVPVITGLGSGSNEGFFFRRVGDSMEYKGTYASSTTTATILSFSLPNNLQVDPSKNPSTTNTASHGHAWNTTATTFPNTTSGPWPVFSDTGLNANLLYVSDTTLGSRFNKANGSTLYATSARCRIEAKGIPILGWSSSVQMSDQTDTRIVAAKYSTTSATAMTSSATTITHGILGFDTHGAMSGSTFTVPVSGIYKIGGSIQLASASWSTGILALDCYVNAVFAGGVAYFTQATASAGTAVITALGSNLFNLKVGDQLTFRGIQTQGGSINLSGSSNYNYINIERLSGPAAIAATESISVIYGNGSGGAIGTSYTLQSFNSKEDDSHGAWTSNNTFTAPAAGRYSLSAQILTDGVTLSTTQSTSIRVYRNGLSWRLLGFARGNGATTINYFLSGSDEFKLNAGETLQIYADSSVATAQVASGGFNRVSIKRVGN